MLEICLHDEISNTQICLTAKATDIAVKIYKSKWHWDYRIKIYDFSSKPAIAYYLRYK